MTATLAENWTPWFQAAERSDIDAALGQLFYDLDQAIQTRGPTCWTSGKCCKFDSFGHRLYVTSLEVAWVLMQAHTTQPHLTTPLVSPSTTDTQTLRIPLTQWQVPIDAPIADACVFQREKLCSIHTIRPLGCRIFFCQQGTEDWQRDLYEQYLTRLRLLHDHYQIEYQYREWRQALRDAMQHMPRRTDQASVRLDPPANPLP